MGMTTHIVGYLPPDEEWQKMKHIWETCRKANVSIPNEVETFFNGSYPCVEEVSGREVNLESGVREFTSDGQHGYIIDIARLPKNIKFLRFYNAW